MTKIFLPPRGSGAAGPGGMLPWKIFLFLDSEIASDTFSRNFFHHPRNLYSYNNFIRLQKLT